MPHGITVPEALEAIETQGPEFFGLIGQADQTRRIHRGDQVRLCGIVNAKSGNCPQDCAFCAQSAHNDAVIDRYPLISAEDMTSKARELSRSKISRFGIVTSGRSIDRDEEIEEIAQAVARITDELPTAPCASLGMLSKEHFQRLREAGLTRYHHNLETAASFYPNICTTQDYQDSVQTVERAKEVGLQVCSGGLFGMGESPSQRVELLEALRNLDVDSLPINFLNPIPGTKLEGMHQLTPQDCLKIVAVARLMMPDKEIRVCGGRETNLRDMQSWIFPAGADGMMVGGYLTTTGRRVEDDLQMLEDLGLTPVTAEGRAFPAD